MSQTSSSSGAENTALSASDAKEIARLLRLLQRGKTGSSLDSSLEELRSRVNAPLPLPTRAHLIACARKILCERNRRAQFLNRAIFGEPAWDMLLGLYVLDGRPLSIGKLVNTVGEPKTTALRWIDYLEKEKLVARRADSVDRRFVQVELLDRGRNILDAYFSSIPDDFGPSG